MPSIAINGRTGQGVETAGEMLATLMTAQGMPHRTWRDFSTIIRGGLTSFEVYTDTAGGGTVTRSDRVEVAVVFDQEGLDRYVSRLAPGGRLFAGQSLPQVGEWRECPRLGYNLWALGIAAGAFHLDRQEMRDAIAARFPGAESLGLAEDGYARGTALGLGSASERGAELVDLTANQALALGALSGGVRFYCGYPITPASDVLEILARALPNLGGTTVQVEDEIAAVHMAVGCSYAGLRTFVATSGPGLSLMTEGIGYAATIEVPLVVVDNQRGGPSTGMPTKTEQSDFEQVRYGGHGEFPRIVLAPTDVGDTALVMKEALNVADAHHALVFLLLDLDLAMNARTVSWPALVHDLESIPVNRGPTHLTGAVENYVRFHPDPDGRTWRTVPGVAGGAYVASGDEHDERGWMEPDFGAVRKTLHHRRLHKVDAIEYQRPWTQVGNPSAPTLLVGTGSMSELIRRTVDDHPTRYQALLVRQIHPLPPPTWRTPAIREVVVAEYNASAQLRRLLGPWWNDLPVSSVLRYDGEHFAAEEFMRAVRDVS